MFFHKGHSCPGRDTTLQGLHTFPHPSQPSLMLTLHGSPVGTAASAPRTATTVSSIHPVLSSLTFPEDYIWGFYLRCIGDHPDMD